MSQVTRRWGWLVKLGFSGCECSFPLPESGWLFPLFTFYLSMNLSEYTFCILYPSLNMGEYHPLFYFLSLNESVWISHLFTLLLVPLNELGWISPLCTFYLSLNLDEHHRFVHSISQWCTCHTHSWFYKIRGSLFLKKKQQHPNQHHPHNRWGSMHEL